MGKKRARYGRPDRRVPPPDGRSGPANRQLAMVTGLAWAILVTGVVGTVLCLSTIPFLGFAPENRYAEATIYFIGPGLLIPFALHVAVSAIRPIWVTPTGQWIRPQALRGVLGRVAVTAPLLMLALGAALLGFGPLTDIVPWIDDLYTDYLGPIVLVALLSSVVLAGIVGAVIMGGWRAAAVGVVFGFGFVAAVVARLTDDPVWLLIGTGALVLSITGFYVIGAVTGWLPGSTTATFDSPVAAILGGVIVAVGIFTAQWVLVFAGGGAIAAWAGIRIAGRMRPVAD